VVFELDEHDRQELLREFPSLNCSLPRQVVWGTLEFNCSFDDSSGELVYEKLFDNYIHDSYEIRIDFNKDDTFGFPSVFEESGIIKEYVHGAGISLIDLHVNMTDESCCLGIFPEYQWYGVSGFIQDKVVPFFYWQSYRRLFGKEPWRGYSHGDDGIREAMRMPMTQSTKGNSRNKLCPCGSGKKYKKCCIQRDALLISKLSKSARSRSN
jgi:SEC-C motif